MMPAAEKPSTAPSCGPSRRCCLPWAVLLVTTTLLCTSSFARVVGAPIRCQSSAEYQYLMLLRPFRYTHVFQDGFLEHTGHYYRALSQKNQEEMDASAYLRWAQTTLQREKTLAEVSLDGALTVEPLLQLLRSELLGKYVRAALQWRCEVLPRFLRTHFPGTRTISLLPSTFAGWWTAGLWIVLHCS
jgi:hypothetical protein